MITSLAVQLEVLDAFSTIPALRPIAIHFSECTGRDSQIVIVPLDSILLEKSMELFKSRMDKAWSFTDCIRFTIMRNRSIELALTADHHFRQAGFQTVFHSDKR
jgi:predicted nucleic acid-binding protein